MKRRSLRRIAIVVLAFGAGCTRRSAPPTCVNSIPREQGVSRRHYQTPVDPPSDLARLVVDFQSADTPGGHLMQAQITAQPIDDARRTYWFAEISPTAGIYVLRNLPPGRKYVVRARRVGYHFVVDTVATWRATIDSAVYRTYITPSCQQFMPTMLPASIHSVLPSSKAR